MILRPCRSYLPLRTLEGALAGPALRSEADAVIVDPAMLHDPGQAAARLRHHPNPRQVRGVRLRTADAPRLIGPLAALLAVSPMTIDLVILSGVGDPAEVRDFAAILREISTTGAPPDLDVEIADWTDPSTIGRIAAAIGSGRSLHLADRLGGKPPGDADLCGVRLIDSGGRASQPAGCFHGRWIAEPEDAPACNALFTPTAEQVRQARRVLDACTAAEGDSLPAVILDCRVVHLRAIRQAVQTVALAEVL